jgi:hypothetical protein
MYIQENQYSIKAYSNIKTPKFQPKLRIGQPDDKYEQEADAVADKVMKMNQIETMQMQPIEEEEEVMQPKLRMQPIEEEEESIQMKCAKCEKEEEMLQPKSDKISVATSSIETQIHSSKGNGSNLTESTNQFMSKAIGADFSAVKIHTGSNAVQMNRQLQARAFTFGSDIYFNSGEYKPESSTGKSLLAHELTHVVQQNGDAQKIQRMSAADALTIAQGLNTTYPNWLDVLPDCPCTYNEAMANPDVWKDSTSPFSSWFHPGAAHDVRTKHGYPTIPDSSHGQQCTYDNEGKLITNGPGAGTPDVWSPETNFWNHQDTDVDTYKALGSNVYVRYWTPNNGNNCEANTGGGGNVSLTPSSESKIIAIRDLLYGWTSEADIRAIISILAGVTSRTEMRAIREDIAPILVSNLSDIGDRTRIRVALARL